MIICHTHYSIQESFCHADDLVKKAGEYKLPYLILADRNTISGCIEFVKEVEAWNKANEHKMRAVVGCQIGVKFDDFSYITLVCKNKEGWYNLCRILATLVSTKEGFEYADHDFIAAHSDGLVWVHGPGEANEIYTRNIDMIRWAQATFSEHAAISGDEVFYVEESDYLYQQILLCSKYGKTLEEFHEIVGMSDDLARFAENSYYLRSTYPETNMELLSKIESFSLANKFMVPQLPGVTNADATLRDICRKGWAKRGINLLTQDKPDLKTVYTNRIKQELDVMSKAGLSMYWLVLHDALQYPLAQGINVGLRGSAGGSIIAYLMGINDLDPVWPDHAYPYDPNKSLLFERFYSDARNIPPSISFEGALV